MSVRLLVKERSAAGGADKGTEVILEDESITLGREKTCQVVLAQQAVSRAHARISRDGSLFFVEDLGSAYGTQINGQTLPKGEKRLLRNGDIIAIAQYDVTFDRVTEQKGKAGESTEQVARQVVKDVMRGLAGGGETPYFRVMNGPKEGQRIELTDATELVIGRDETADLIFKDDLVSRRHAKIRRDWSGTHVEDLESRNGIKVNKKRVTRKTLKDRDEVEVGGIRLLYLDPSEVREAPVVLPDEEGESTSHEEAPDPEKSDEQPALAEEPKPAEAAEAAPEEAPAEAPPEEPAAEAPEPGGEEPPPEGQAGEGEEPGEEPADEGDGEEEGEAPIAKKKKKGGAGGGLAALGDKKTLIPLVAMGVFAVMALVLIIAVIAGF
ncbi:MAG: FHA domain-containing protein [Myxococcaceae bacterium]